MLSYIYLFIKRIRGKHLLLEDIFIIGINVRAETLSSSFLFQPFTYRIKIINTIILEFGTFGHILVTEFHFLNLMFSYFIRIEFHLLNQCFYIGIIFILRIEFLTGLETWTTAASITRTRRQLPRVFS